MSTTADRFDSNSVHTNSLNSNSVNAGGSQREAEKHSEGPVTRKIEDQTARVPSDIFLLGALASIGLSLVLEISGEKDKSRFVGQWVSPFLLLGVYNKLVKVAGSDRVHAS